MPDPEPSHPSDVSRKPSPSVLLETVKQAFGFLDKSMKTMNLYAGKGAFIDRHIDEMLRCFDELFRDVPVLTVGVTPFEFTFANEPVYQAREGTRGFSYRMFSDGVRELAFRRGLTREELRDFLDIVRGGSRQDKSEDTVTLLWERSFEHIDYEAIDLFAEGGIFDVNPERQRSMEDKIDAIVKRTLARVKDRVRLNTRVGLSNDEMEFLSGHNAQWEQQIAGLAAIRMAMPVIPKEDLAALVGEIQGGHRNLVLRFMEVMFEIISCPERILDFDQTMDILESIGDSFLNRGDWEALNRYSQHLVELAAEEGGKSQRAEFVSQLVHRLASQARIDAVVAELEKADAKAVPHIHRFLSLLPADTLPIQVQAFMNLPEGKAKTDLMALLISRGADLTDYLIERLKTGGSAAALVAVRQLRQLGTPRAVSAIIGSLSHPSLTLRREALAALKGLHSDEVRQAVLKLLSGPDAKEMGVAAIDFLLSSTSPHDVAAVTSFCMGDGFESLEIEEQKQIVRLLATSGREEAWTVFSDILGRHSLIPRKKLIDLQLTLVAALGRKPDPRATSLLRSRLELRVWRDPLREACEDALRRIAAPAATGPDPAR